MKRKILSILLVTTICCSLLVGCSGDSEKISENNTQETNQEKEENTSNKIENTEINIPVDNSSIEKDEIEEPTTEVPTNPDNEKIETKEYIDFSSLKETSIKEGLYDNVDINKYIPTNNFEVSMSYEDIMTMILAVSDSNSYMSVSSKDIAYELYTIDDKLYSSTHDLTKDEIIYNYALIEETDESLTSTMSTTDYSTADIKDVKYKKALIDKDGKIFDVLDVFIDEREEDEKDMLAYETENGIMYLDKDTTMTINGITYGGENGIQPLDEIPLTVHTFYIERDSEELKAIEYEDDGVIVTSYINEIKEITLPSDYDFATKTTSEEISMQMLGVIMMIAFQDVPDMDTNPEFDVNSDVTIE